MKKVLIVLLFTVTLVLGTTAEVSAKPGPEYYFEDAGDGGNGVLGDPENHWIVNSGVNTKVRGLGEYNSKFAHSQYDGMFAYADIYVKPIEGMQIDVWHADQLYFRYTADIYGQEFYGTYEITDTIHHTSAIPRDSQGNFVEGVFYNYVDDYILVTYSNFNSFVYATQTQGLVDYTSAYTVFNITGTYAKVEFSNRTEYWLAYVSNDGNDLLITEPGSSLDYFILSDTPGMTAVVQTISGNYVISVDATDFVDTDAEHSSSGYIPGVLIIIN